MACWLIRNGQAGAVRQDAVGMLGEWLAAMPQVRAQGDAEQVFTHLLNRSGLLREPVPGAVDFVHRTFQDRLGAKAAVEARDFGVLVRNAHDDQWDDAGSFSPPESLNVQSVPRVDLADLLPHQRLTTVCLGRIDRVDTIEALAHLPP
ncbi:hypothetical protein [Streptomyces sp. NRRL B-3648]|uniref:hypothetical protein n=1 Tax=Streptomyces sp. NRRL B-3648 TaxID=1519493 RepID=UPI0018FE8944|nr:hypothetical protein [Streptomyces sp. NRRL B-3648]